MRERARLIVAVVVCLGAVSCAKSSTEPSDGAGSSPGTGSSKTASLVASFTPDPIPFHGKTCTIGIPIDPDSGCIYQTLV